MVNLVKLTINANLNGNKMCLLSLTNHHNKQPKLRPAQTRAIKLSKSWFLITLYSKTLQTKIQEANIDILDIEANHRKDILSTELEDFKTSLYNIERETSAVYNDLCTWKTSHARPPAGANEECAATIEAKHTTLAQSPEPERDEEEATEAAKSTHMCLTLDYECLEQEATQHKGLAKDAWKAQVLQLERNIPKLKTNVNTSM